MRGIRRTIAVGVLALTPVASALAAATQSPTFGRTATVTSGRWGGDTWKLLASDRVSGQSVGYCIHLSVNGAAPSGQCTSSGFVLKPFPGLPAYGMNVIQSTTGCPGISYVDGPVVSNAKEVAITLTTGKVVRTKTIAPPAGLVSTIGFYVARIPCGTQPTRAIGLNAAGKVAARFSGS